MSVIVRESYPSPGMEVEDHSARQQLLHPVYMITDDVPVGSDSTESSAAVPLTQEDTNRWISIVPSVALPWAFVRPYRVVYSPRSMGGQLESAEIRLQGIVGCSRLEPQGLISEYVFVPRLYFVLPSYLTAGFQVSTLIPPRSRQLVNVGDWV